MDAPQTKTIELESVEINFLLTILKSCCAVFTALVALQDSVPGLSPPPLDTEAIIKIAALAEKIQQQTSV
jgi:hypothetical protein